jgi:hypothetical protein
MRLRTWRSALTVSGGIDSKKPDWNERPELARSRSSVESECLNRGEHLPDEGEIIDVVRFLRGHAIRARVTHVNANSKPQIEATEIG